jgi:hypothetical protein
MNLYDMETAVLYPSFFELLLKVSSYVLLSATGDAALNTLGSQAIPRLIHQFSRSGRIYHDSASIIGGHVPASKTASIGFARLMTADGSS